MARSVFSAALAGNQLEALRELHQGLPDSPPERGWDLSTLTGRLCELTSSGRTPLLTAATALVLQAQQQGQPIAWIGVGDATFYPPDVAAWGVDLAALPVIRVRESRLAARAADHLLRSGAFGLVVLDLGAKANLPMAIQARLGGLVRKHNAVLLFLTRTSSRTGSRSSSQADFRASSQASSHTSSLGSLVSLRAEGSTHRTAFHRFSWELHIVKDKQGGPGWRHSEECRGPDGLC